MSVEGPSASSVPKFALRKRQGWRVGRDDRRAVAALAGPSDILVSQR